MRNRVKDIRNLFRLKKRLSNERQNNFFDHEKEDYYKPVRVGCFLSNNYIEYESSGDRNKTLRVREYLNKIRPYLKDIINNLKISDTCKIQLTITIILFLNINF